MPQISHGAGMTTGTVNRPDTPFPQVFHRKRAVGTTPAYNAALPKPGESLNGLRIAVHNRRCQPYFQ